MAVATVMNDDRFLLSGTIDGEFQLLLEALELASASGDRMAADFEALLVSLQAQSDGWQ